MAFTQFVRSSEKKIVTKHLRKSIARKGPKPDKHSPSY